MSLTLDPNSLFTAFKIRLDSLSQAPAGKKAQFLDRDFAPWLRESLEQGLPINRTFLRQRILSACYNIPEREVVRILDRNGL